MHAFFLPIWDFLVDKTGGPLPAATVSIVAGAVLLKFVSAKLLTLPFKLLWAGVRNSPRIISGLKPSGALVKVGATAAGTYAVARSDFVQNVFELAKEAPPEQLVMVTAASALAVYTIYTTAINFLGWVGKGANSSFNTRVPSIVSGVVAVLGGVALAQGLSQGHLTTSDPVLYPMALLDAALVGFSIWGLKDPKGLKESLAYSGPIHLASLCTAGVVLHEIPIRARWIPEAWQSGNFAWVSEGSSFALLGMVALAAVGYGIRTAAWNTKRRRDKIEEEGTPEELANLAKTVGIAQLRALALATEVDRGKKRARAARDEQQGRREEIRRGIEPLHDLLGTSDDDGSLADELIGDEDNDDPLEGMSLAEVESAEREARRAGGRHPRLGVSVADLGRRAIYLRVTA